MAANYQERTNGYDRCENRAVLVQRLEPSEKKKFFCPERFFFTCLALSWVTTFELRSARK